MSVIVGEILTFSHGDGEIELRVYGDEFLARYESLDGYTAVRDNDLNIFCYASLHDGKLVSTGKDITGPIPNGITRHLKENQSERKRKFNDRHREIYPPSTDTIGNFAFGPNNGLLDGKRISEGDVIGLTVLVEFADVSTSVTAKDVTEMLNDLNYNKNGNHCSVYEYFHTMSSGKLRYINHVIGPIKLSQKLEYYKNHLLIKEAMDIVVNDLGIDLSKYDSQNRGIIDALNFLYAGRTVYEENLWPHNSIINLEYNGIKTHFYMLASCGRDTSDLSIGTFCHETGHLLLRLVDNYDYGYRDGDEIESQGIGVYCLMGSGNHLNRGRTPSPICAFSRNLINWCDNEIILHKNSYVAKHSDYNTIMKYPTDNSKEYFVIENRNALDLDSSLPSSGLAIYHCDTQGSNEYQDGTKDRHFQCAILQADGKLDLENNRNRGDSTDLYDEVTGIALSYSTTPSSRLWDESDSGLIVSDIHKLGSNISFNII
ncbi:M6 family metalloprotease domain-containing protein [Oceanirhabdus sp. W0125-5]|uniref:M6 family metalloprotease domain-containing protein n=1 Tax=Oceanirhabdus sp. W0125-5 TaxID=2999116 RepID=UPI0022F2B521|nr:M6 family metalloprotease domain-containing protein [Oceanirhabdus sp. W0125-5]WBW98358.1 M6 family metalloprotease domain-containing protein [Oceanirhabdus sp. W0125-5]